jgi:CRP/FNR family transcriptional activator FtrB
MEVLLAALKDPQIAHRVSSERWAPGTLWQSGQNDGQSIFVVRHGRLELAVMDAEGRERSLRVLAESELFGTEALSALSSPSGAGGDALRQDYGIRAVTYSEVLQIPLDIVDLLIIRLPLFRKALTNSIANHIWALEREREHGRSMPTNNRLLCYLRCGENGHQPQQKPLGKATLPMQLLARRIGCSAGHLSRSVSTMVREGILLRQDGRLQLKGDGEMRYAFCEGCA